LPPKGTLPDVEGRVNLRAASLLIPGLTEPLNVPKATLTVRNQSITASPIVAVLGTSVFTGRVEHSGDRRSPWRFDVKANALSIEQGALWFDALGNRQPVPLLLRLPGFSSLVKRRTAATNLFNALNAKGKFSTPRLTYRALVLHDFQSDVNISGRVIRAKGRFHAGGGRGEGKLDVDLTQSPARIDGEAELAAAHLQPLAPFLPASLRQSRGIYSVSMHVGTLGLSRQEIAANLQGQATVQLKNINFGDFDPLAALARAEGRSESGSVRGELTMRSVILNLQIKDQRVTTASEPFVLSGTDVNLKGWCDFNGATDVTITAGVRASARPAASQEEASSFAHPLRLHLSGPFNKLEVERPREVSRTVP
jgi:hypothetical protein